MIQGIDSPEVENFPLVPVLNGRAGSSYGRKEEIDMTKSDMEKRDEQGITGYLLVVRGKDWDVGMSDEELQEVMDRTMQWCDALMKSGKVKGGNALERTGVIVSGKGGSVVIDGPFAESKEAVGGYLLLDVATLEEAVEIAKSSPGVDYGISIEVRPVLSECPVFKRAKQRLKLAA